MTEPSRALEATLLTSQDCLLCHDTEALLNLLASEFPLVIMTVDAASPQGAALAERYGLAFTPGLILDGEPFGYGRLSERALRRELARRCSNTSTGLATLSSGPAAPAPGRIKRALSAFLSRSA